jgi:hypothetical protein
LVTLIGSGEVSASMTRVHRALLARLDEPPHLAFVDTPAGFELGLESIHSRFRDYVERRLGLPLAIISYHSVRDDACQISAALEGIVRSNYFLAGPGSPTYAVRQWSASPVMAAIVQRWRQGAQLVWASSAAIALGRHVLPVYEIYKVGQALHWEEGLDLLGLFGLELAVVPHWDNAEGGTHDTRACFMGAARFECLKAMLPLTAVVLGIDEHTAVTIDTTSGEVQVRGRGGVTVARAEESSHYAAGEIFPMIELMTSSARTPKPPKPPPIGKRPPESDALTLASSQIAAGDLASALRSVASAAPSDLAPVLLQAACAAAMMPEAESVDRLLSLLVQTRDALRKAHQWELADCLRDRLGELGVNLQDTPSGTEHK